MKLNIYTIFDTATAAYLRPWYAQSDAQAIREFTDEVARKDSQIGHHPEDYYLVRIGDYSDQTATIVSQTPETLITGLEARASANKTGKANLDMFGPDIVPVREADSDGDAHGFVREADIVNKDGSYGGTE